MTEAVVHTCAMCGLPSPFDEFGFGWMAVRAIRKGHPAAVWDLEDHRMACPSCVRGLLDLSVQRARRSTPGIEGGV